MTNTDGDINSKEEKSFVKPKRKYTKKSSDNNEDSDVKKNKYSKKQGSEWEAARRKRFNDAIELLRHELSEREFSSKTPKIEIVQAALQFIQKHKSVGSETHSNGDKELIKDLKKENLIFRHILKETGVTIQFQDNKVSYTQPAQCDCRTINVGKDNKLVISDPSNSVKEPDLVQQQVLPNSETSIQSDAVPTTTEMSSSVTLTQTFSCSTSLPDSAMNSDSSHPNNLLNNTLLSEIDITKDTQVDLNKERSGSDSANTLSLDNILPYSINEINSLSKDSNMNSVKISTASVPVILNSSGSKLIVKDIVNTVPSETQCQNTLKIQQPLNKNVLIIRCDNMNKFVKLPENAIHAPEPHLTLVTPSLTNVPIMSTGLSGIPGSRGIYQSNSIFPIILNAPLLSVPHSGLKRIAPKPPKETGDKNTQKVTQELKISPKVQYKRKKPEDSELIPLVRKPDIVLPKVDIISKEIPQSTDPKISENEKSSEAIVSNDIENVIDLPIEIPDIIAPSANEGTEERFVEILNSMENRPSTLSLTTSLGVSTEPLVLSKNISVESESNSLGKENSEVIVSQEEVNTHPLVDNLDKEAPIASGNYSVLSLCTSFKSTENKVTETSVVSTNNSHSVSSDRTENDSSKRVSCASLPLFQSTSDVSSSSNVFTSVKSGLSVSSLIPQTSVISKPHSIPSFLDNTLHNVNPKMLPTMFLPRPPFQAPHLPLPPLTLPAMPLTTTVSSSSMSSTTSIYSFSLGSSITTCPNTTYSVTSDSGAIKSSKSTETCLEGTSSSQENKSADPYSILNMNILVKTTKSTEPISSSKDLKISFSHSGITTSMATTSITKSIFSLAPISSYPHPFPFCALPISDAPTSFSFTLTKTTDTVSKDPNPKLKATAVSSQSVDASSTKESAISVAVASESGTLTKTNSSITTKASSVATTFSLWPTSSTISYSLPISSTVNTVTSSSVYEATTASSTISSSQLYSSARSLFEVSESFGSIQHFSEPVRLKESEKLSFGLESFSTSLNSSITQPHVNSSVLSNASLSKDRKSEIKLVPTRSTSHSEQIKPIDPLLNKYISEIVSTGSSMKLNVDNDVSNSSHYTYLVPARTIPESQETPSISWNTEVCTYVTDLSKNATSITSAKCPVTSLKNEIIPTAANIFVSSNQSNVEIASSMHCVTSSVENYKTAPTKNFSTHTVCSIEGSTNQDAPLDFTVIESKKTLKSSSTSDSSKSNPKVASIDDDAGKSRTQIDNKLSTVDYAKDIIVSEKEVTNSSPSISISHKSNFNFNLTEVKATSECSSTKPSKVHGVISSVSNTNCMNPIVSNSSLLGTKSVNIQSSSSEKEMGVKLSNTKDVSKISSSMASNSYSSCSQGNSMSKNDNSIGTNLLDSKQKDRFIDTMNTKKSISHDTDRKDKVSLPVEKSKSAENVPISKYLPRDTSNLFVSKESSTLYQNKELKSDRPRIQTSLNQSNINLHQGNKNTSNMFQLHPPQIKSCSSSNFGSAVHSDDVVISQQQFHYQPMHTNQSNMYAKSNLSHDQINSHKDVNIYNQNNTLSDLPAQVQYQHPKLQTQNVPHGQPRQFGQTQHSIPAIPHQSSSNNQQNLLTKETRHQHVLQNVNNMNNFALAPGLNDDKNKNQHVVQPQQNQIQQSPMGSGTTYTNPFDYNPYYKKNTHSPRTDARQSCYGYQKHNAQYYYDIVHEPNVAQSSTTSFLPPFLETPDDVTARIDESCSDAVRYFSVSHLVSPFNDVRKIPTQPNLKEGPPALMPENKPMKEQTKSKTNVKKNEKLRAGVSGKSNTTNDTKRRSPARSSGHSSNSNLTMWSKNNYSAEALISSQTYSRPNQKPSSLNQNYHFMSPNQMYQGSYPPHQIKNFVQNSTFGYGGHERNTSCNADYNLQLHTQPVSLPYCHNMPYMSSSYPYQNFPPSSPSIVPSDIMSQHPHGPYAKFPEFGHDHANFSSNTSFPLPLEPQEMYGTPALGIPNAGMCVRPDLPFGIAPNHLKSGQSKNNPAGMTGLQNMQNTPNKKSRYNDNAVTPNIGTPSFFDGSALSHIPLHSFTPPCEDSTFAHTNFLPGTSRQQSSNLFLGSDNYGTMNSIANITGENASIAVSSSGGQIQNNGQNSSRLPTALSPRNSSSILPGQPSGSSSYNPRVSERHQVNFGAPPIPSHLSSSLANFNLTSIIPEIDGKNPVGDEVVGSVPVNSDEATSLNGALELSSAAVSAQSLPSSIYSAQSLSSAVYSAAVYSDNLHRFPPPIQNQASDSTFTNSHQIALNAPLPPVSISGLNFTSDN